jgi:flagellin-like hook-associated protein FlgL
MIIDTSLLSQITSNSAPSSPARVNTPLTNSTPAPLPSVDDLSSLSVPASLDAQAQGTEAVSAGVGSAISYTQTQDGYLQNIAAALGRMSDLSQAAQDSSTSPADRDNQNGEFTTLNGYVLGAASKDFNGVSLFSSSPLQVTVDGNGTTLSLPGVNLTADALGENAGASLGTTAAAASAFSGVQGALAQLALDRATVQNNQATLNRAADKLNVTLANLDSANLPITDAAGADAATEAARNEILSDPNAALAAQAQSLPQTVIDLLP